MLFGRCSVGFVAKNEKWSLRDETVSFLICSGFFVFIRAPLQLLTVRCIDPLHHRSRCLALVAMLYTQDVNPHDPITTARVCNKPTPTHPSRKVTAFYFFILTITFLCGRHLLLRPSSVYNSNNNIDTSKSTLSIKEITTVIESNDNDTKISIPPLKDLLDKNGKVINDISWMLDFAIIAFPKSGTSFLKNYLNETEE